MNIIMAKVTNGDDVEVILNDMMNDGFEERSQMRRESMERVQRMCRNQQRDHEVIRDLLSRADAIVSEMFK